MRKDFFIWILAIIFLIFLWIFGFYISNKNSSTEIIVNPLTNLTWDITQNYITNMIFFHTQALTLTDWYMKNWTNENLRSLASATYSLKTKEMNILSWFAYKYNIASVENKNIIFPKKNIQDFYFQNIKANHQIEINLSRQISNSQVPIEIKVFAKKVDVALSSQLEQLTRK